MTIAQTPADDRLVATRFMRPFRTIGNDDVAAFGGKNASLGEMYRTALTWWASSWGEYPRLPQ
jgi:hypothetical protein